MNIETIGILIKVWKPAGDFDSSGIEVETGKLLCSLHCLSPQVLDFGKQSF